MNRSIRWTSVVFATLVAGLPLVGGCAGPTGPALMVVTGTVSIDGKPAATVFVTLTPDASKGTMGPASSGATNDKGEFRVYAPGNREGAVVGSHKVTVSCPFAANMGSSASGTAEAGGGCSIAKKFQSVDTTPLVAEVTAKGPNMFKLEVTAK